MAIFFVAAIWPAGRRARVAVLVVCAAVFLASTLYAAKVFFQVCYPEDTVASVLFDYRAGTGFEGMYEYEPPAATTPASPPAFPTPASSAIRLSFWASPIPTTPTPIPYGVPTRAVARPHSRLVHGNQTNPEHREIRATTAHAGYLGPAPRQLSRMAHSRQRRRPRRALPKRDDGLIAVPVPQGPVDLTVDWTSLARRPGRPLGQRIQRAPAHSPCGGVERRRGLVRLT